MLTVDHVKIRRKKGVVEVVPLCGLDVMRARELADVAVEIVQAHDGAPRAELEEALDALPMEPREQRFGRGLKKLALDACDFDIDSEVPPAELRAEVFAAAADARAAGTFARDAVLAGVATARGIDNGTIESALFADLSAAHAVTGFDIVDAGEMIERYRVRELQAVLLRATRVVAHLAASPAELRAVLRAVKLHQLLFDVEVLDTSDGGDGTLVPGLASAARVDGGEGGAWLRRAGSACCAQPPDDGGLRAGGGVRLTLEGPMGLFQQSTRYGLKLAMLLPSLLACRRHRIEAAVRLRKHGGVETCVMSGNGAGPALVPSHSGALAGALSEGAAALLAELEAAARKGGRWTASVASDVLTLPGTGAIVPDLQVAHTDTGQVVFVEVLGFWSRAAVWRRVELVEKGLPYRVVFCASERLRVSEEALPDDAGGALVVFKGALKASRVLEAIERVAR
jgi:predicted nuclease of restriction endonuclease-like RecB superfamily